jgi:hypothetical protein
MPLSLLIEGGFPGAGRFELARYVTSLNSESRAEAEQKAGIKHGRLIGPAACFAALAGTALLSRTVAGPTGLICTGGPWALPACSRFVDRMSTAGAGFVNPLQFPSTLLSGTATSIAGAIGAHAFAIVVGHDRLAFFDALHNARAYLRSGLVRQVIVAAISAADPVIERARECAGLLLPTLDVAAAFAVVDSPPIDLQLLDLSFESISGANVRHVYRADWREEKFVCSIETPLSFGEAFGAAGAVFCLSAANFHLTTCDPTEPFTICVAADGRCASATFALREFGQPRFR